LNNIKPAIGRYFCDRQWRFIDENPDAFDGFIQFFAYPAEGVGRNGAGGLIEKNKAEVIRARLAGGPGVVEIGYAADFYFGPIRLF